MDKRKLLLYKFMKVELGINTGFAINRFPEPEDWARITGKELGLHTVQWTADLLNPFLPRDIINSYIKRTKRETRKYSVKIDTTFTSVFTRVNHLLHPDKKVRHVWEEWFRKFLRISVELGARGAGSHFGILSVMDCRNPRRKRYIVEEGINAWQRLSSYAKKLGLEFLMFEPMSIEREMASTIKDTKELLEKVNSKAEIPIYLCLDVDHGSNISTDHRDRDPYAWLKELGGFSPVVHIKQSFKDKGGHWPFTREYNRRGIIHPQKVIKALEESGAGHVVLCLEISHRERHPAEDRVVKDLKKSVNYWKRFI